MSTEDATDRSGVAELFQQPSVATAPRIKGQRCKLCAGAVRWRMSAGGRPEHVYAQDFESVKTTTQPQRGVGHPVVLEAGEPTHVWVPGSNGGPDVALYADGTARVAGVKGTFQADDISQLTVDTDTTPEGTSE